LTVRKFLTAWPPVECLRSYLFAMWRKQEIKYIVYNIAFTSHLIILFSRFTRLEPVMFIKHIDGYIMCVRTPPIQPDLTSHNRASIRLSSLHGLAKITCCLISQRKFAPGNRMTVSESAPTCVVLCVRKPHHLHDCACMEFY
jgi:hypothetical protein